MIAESTKTKPQDEEKQVEEAKEDENGTQTGPVTLNNPQKRTKTMIEEMAEEPTGRVYIK